MRLKKILYAGIGVILCCQASVCYAGEYVSLGLKMWIDLMSSATGFLVRMWEGAAEGVHYDISAGLEKIKSNIGMYRDQGDCGVSATGNTGCDLTTPEEGAAADAEMDEEAAVIPESTISIITRRESDGEITSDGQNGENSVDHQGDTFDLVRQNVADYVFISDDTAVNADCTCSAGTGEACDQSECAQQRQNDLLFQSSLGASSTSDAYLQDIDQRYRAVSGLASEVASAETVADFVGKMGSFSVFASDAAAHLITLQTYDLRAQSYRNLVFGGINPVVLDKQEQGESK